MSEVRSSASGDLGIVGEDADHPIAGPTQQTTHPPSAVIVVNTEAEDARRIGVVGHPADRTTAALLNEQPVVVLDRHAVATELVLPAPLPRPVRVSTGVLPPHSPLAVLADATPTRVRLAFKPTLRADHADNRSCGCFTKAYTWAVTGLHCCGCIVGIVALPVLTAGAFTTYITLT